MTTQEEAVHAEQIGRTIFEVMSTFFPRNEELVLTHAPCLSFFILQASYSNSLIAEGCEPENFFWVALGGRGDYDKVGTAMNDLNSPCGCIGNFFSITLILGKGF